MSGGYDENRTPPRTGLRVGLAVVAAVLLACASAGGLGAVVWFTTVAAEQRQRAENEAQRARAEAEQERPRADGGSVEPTRSAARPSAVLRGDACTVVFVNRSSGPCKVTVAGRDAKGRASFDANLSADGAQMTAVVRRPAPYTIERITVEQGGRKDGRAINLRLRAGATYEVRVGPGGTAEVIEAGAGPG